MEDTQIVLIAIVAVVLIALVAWAGIRSLRTRRLKQQFGPEYERTIQQTGGDRKKAESVLGDRVSRREHLTLQPLSRDARENYLRRWLLVQAEFVDQPEATVQRAQTLLDEVMTERGYPTGEVFEEQVDLLSVDHPTVIEHYRIAHRLHQEGGETDDVGVSTEERRKALISYRALFADLLDAPEAGRGSGDGADEEILDRERRAS